MLKVKVRHSLDLEEQKKRLDDELSKRKNDPYCIHTEDYEDINDLINRAYRTRTVLKPNDIGHMDIEPHYDDDEDIAHQLESDTYIDQSAVTEKETAVLEDDAKRSGGKDDKLTAVSTDEPQMP